MMRRLHVFTLICISVLIAPLSSQARQFAISMEQDQLTVGEKVEILLVSLAGGADKTAPFPDEISCELIAAEKKFVLLALKDPSSKESEATGNTSGLRQHYSFTLPSILQGQVVMSFADVDAPRIVFDVVAPPQGDAEAAPDAVRPSLDAMSSTYEPYQKNASAYQPVYFLVGTDPAKSKFQISFKYRFFGADTSFAELHPWIKGLHMGYTQTSFWDLQSASAPFEDTSYKPELFWLSQNYLTSAHGLLRGVFLQGGFQHESNGRGEDLSRSTNFAYIEPILIFYDPDSKFGFQLSPKIWTYVENDDDTNATLPDYRGYFDLGAKFSLAETFVAGTQFRWADEGVSLQLDFSYPLKHFFGDALDVYFFAQYTNALAEDLLHYEDRSQIFRLGLAFIR